MGYNIESDLEDRRTANGIRRQLELGLPVKEDFREKEKATIAYTNGKLTRAEYCRYLRACGRLSASEDPLGHFVDGFRDMWIATRTFLDRWQIEAMRSFYTAFGYEVPDGLLKDGHPTEVLRNYRSHRRKKII